MKCQNCGQEVEKGEKICRHCGAEILDEKFYQQTWFIVLSAIVIPPLGIFLIWKYNKLNEHKALKIILTIILTFTTLIYIIALTDPDTEKESKNETTEAATTNTTNKPTTTKPTTTKKETTTLTMGQQNALKTAKSYLSMAGFSHSGLIKQLEYEGYSTEDATFAADNCGADWNEQAAKAAKSYISMTSFSRTGLIEQLEYEGFTKEQAEYGATAVGY